MPWRGAWWYLCALFSWRLGRLAERRAAVWQARSGVWRRRAEKFFHKGEAR